MGGNLQMGAQRQMGTHTYVHTYMGPAERSEEGLWHFGLSTVTTDRWSVVWGMEEVERGRRELCIICHITITSSTCKTISGL